MSSVRALRAKKKCCKDAPRCRKCPTTLKRLTDAGYAERESRRDFEVAKRIPKKVLAAARSK